MRAETKKKLEAAGFRVGDARQFLGLSKIEDTLVDLKLALADTLRAVRERQRLTQAQLAKRIRSSQSRVAKMEAGDTSVSLDLLMKTLLAAGAKRSELGKAFTSRRRVS
jgi:ribosome-binding protein aMBF1 (putative translation factor)